MTPQELKSSVLQLAIQGKLVEQIENEERITCKSTLHTDASELFEIPDSWFWLSLKDVVSVTTGLSFKKQDQRDSSSGELRVLRGGNIGDDFHFHLYDDDIFVDIKQFEEKYTQLLNGDVIMPSVTSIEKMCKTAFICTDLENITAGGFVYIIRCLDNSILDPKYLQLFISSSFNKEQCKPNIHKSGQAFYNLKKTGFMEQPICVPPLPEQRRIVAKIEELLPLIDRYEKAWSRLEDFNKRFPVDMQKSILQMAIQGKLVEQRPEEGTGEELFQQIQAEKQRLIKASTIKKEKPLPEIAEDEIPFEIPERWKWVRLSYIAESIVDCPHSTPKYLDIETEYCTIDTNCIDAKGDITKWRYVDSDTYTARIARLTPQKDDIVYTREGSICRAAILPEGLKVCLGQRVMLIRSANGVFPQFIRRVLMSPMVIRKLTEQQKGIGAKHVNVSDVCNLILPLPPLAEQKRIVAKLEEILPLCERLK